MSSLERDAYEVLQVHPHAHQLVIQAAYRVLAAIHHPDRDPSAATHKMAELNAAYAQLRTPDLRATYDQCRELAKKAETPSRPSGHPTRPHDSSSSSGPRSATVDFGRYAGWTISQIAGSDLDYLRWLSRHSSGIRFRREIEREVNARTQRVVAATGRRRRWGSRRTSGEGKP